MRWLGLIAPALIACGTEGGVDGGSANLPNRGIGGWERVTPGDALFVMPSTDGVIVADPSALVVDDVVVLYFTASSGTDVAIRRVTSEDGATFSAASVVLEDARQPSVVAKPGGFWLASVDGSGNVGLAESVDGLTFTRVAASNLPVASDPSLVRVDDTLVLFAVSPDGAIIRCEAGPDLAFGPTEVVLEPIADCTDAFGATVPCWDGKALGGPDVRLATNANGRAVWRMWFNGRTGTATDLGFAASFDGHAWTRYAFNPVIDDSGSQLGPSSVVLGDDYLLYWSESGASSGIALGVISPTASRGAPSETW